MLLRGSISSVDFLKSIDYIFKNGTKLDDITLLFTKDSVVFYSDIIYGNLDVFSNLELKSKHQFNGVESIGITMKLEMLNNVALKMKGFESFELMLIKGPKMKFYTHQFYLTCEVELLHPSSYRNEMCVPTALKFKLPDLKKYVGVLASTGDFVVISVGDYLMMEQEDNGMSICIKLAIEIVELQSNEGNVFKVIVPSTALHKLFKSHAENSIGCISKDFFGIYILLPKEGWMILSINTIVE